ncbi:MAG: GGDEF domain-containing protein [Nitrospirae bacterium]|nr:GGDEF domain-containing protein [Nitrospirota bacterium]
MISLFLKEIVEKKDLYARKASSLRSVINLMNKNGQGVVVLLDGKKPVGIVTERDVIGLLFNRVDLDDKAVVHAQTSLISTRGDRSIGHALNLMIENNIRRMIVVDEDDDFLGVVTQKNVLKYLEDDFYLSQIKVKHIMEKLRPMTVAAPGNSVHEVLQKMHDSKISAVPIVSGENVVGIITEKDIIELAGKSIPLSTKVSGHMSKPVITMNPDSFLVDVVKLMNDQSIRRVVIEDRAKRPLGIVTIRDVLKNLECDYCDFLERKLRNTRDFLNLMPGMLIEVSDTGNNRLIVWANDKVFTRFGRDIIDKPVTELVPPAIWNKMYKTLLASNRIENVRFKKNEDMYQASGFYIKTDGKVENGRIQLMMVDITEDIKLSFTDPLTGLYNRRFINEVLMKEIERDKRLGKEFSIVLLDIDNFKRVNDTYGHLSGDEVLKTVAMLMTDNVRKFDVVGRYGGEEFVIIMPETPKITAFDVSERIRSILEKKSIGITGRKRIKLTASFGIATFQVDGMSSAELLLLADERLYKAKKEGKNRVVDR